MARAKSTTAAKSARRPRPGGNKPLMPVKPKRTRRFKGLRPAIRAVLERAKLRRRELDEIADGADLADIDHLPDMIAGPARSKREADPNTKPAKREERRLPDPKLSKAGRRKPCTRCNRLAHPDMTCKELDDWLKTAGAVLAAELPETLAI